MPYRGDASTSYRRDSRSPPPRRRSRSPPSRGRDFREDRGSRDTHRHERVPRDDGGRPKNTGDVMEYGKRSGQAEDEPPPPVVPSKPNFERSGKLAADTNTFKGVVLKYHEPPEARKPNKTWRLYVFKDGEQVDMFPLGRQSCYLFGRDKTITDIPILHPSASKQHAVIQFRRVGERNDFGDTKNQTKPFLIDLDSANGTTVGGETVPPSRFFELKSGDVKFAHSSREYVLLIEA